MQTVCELFGYKNIFEKLYIERDASLVYYLMDMIILNDKIQILFLPRNKKMFSEFIIVQTYDLNLNLLNEEYFTYSNQDKIFRADIIPSEDKSISYLLIQSKQRKWQLTTLK